jgi:hypothetical protein
MSDGAWKPMSTEGAPAGRSGFVSVWTGSRWFIWGGTTGFDGKNFLFSGDGGLYDPKTDRWEKVSDLHAPSPRQGAAAAWTGTHVLVYGGSTDQATNDGGLFDPVKNEWSPLPQADPPTGRHYQSTAWTGSAWLWLCGARYNDRRNDGVRFDPASRNWTALSWPDAPPARWGCASAWTGEELLLFGGFGAHSGYAQGHVAYHPGKDTWRALAEKGAPSRRTHGNAVWTGTELFIWGGISTVGGKDMAKGGLYDPKADAWRKVATKGEPAPRALDAQVWTGKEIAVWGGTVRQAPPGTVAGPGGLYDPARKAWRPLPPGEPVARGQPRAVWTGSELLVWGGERPEANYKTTYLAEGYRVAL